MSRKRYLGISALLLTTLALNACNSNSSFGSTYDECILKNSKSKEEDTPQYVADSCRRHFEKKVDFDVGISAELDMPSLDELMQNAPVSGTFTVTNPNENSIATSVHVAMTYDLLIPGVGGKEPTKGQKTSVYWDYDTLIEPGRDVKLGFNLDKDVPWRRAVNVTAKATTAMPLKSSLF